MLVIPMDLVNLHDVADLLKYLVWYTVIPDLVCFLTHSVYLLHVFGPVQ